MHLATHQHSQSCNRNPWSMISHSHQEIILGTPILKVAFLLLGPLFGVSFLRLLKLAMSPSIQSSTNLVV